MVLASHILPPRFISLVSSHFILALHIIFSPTHIFTSSFDTTRASRMIYHSLLLHIPRVSSWYTWRFRFFFLSFCLHISITSLSLSVHCLANCQSRPSFSFLIQLLHLAWSDIPVHSFLYYPWSPWLDWLASSLPDCNIALGIGQSYTHIHLTYIILFIRSPCIVFDLLI